VLDGKSVTMYRSILVSPTVGRGRAHRGRHRIARHAQVSLNRNFFETHIRHNSSLPCPARQVRPLVGAMIFAPLLARLVARIGRPPSPRRARKATFFPAILLPSEVWLAHVERLAAPHAAQIVKRKVRSPLHPPARTE